MPHHLDAACSLLSGKQNERLLACISRMAKCWWTGAQVNGLPPDEMETMGQGTVIAVDAAPYQTLRLTRGRGIRR